MKDVFASAPRRVVTFDGETAILTVTRDSLEVVGEFDVRHGLIGAVRISEHPIA